MIKRNLFVFADGGARGNPGPAAAGFIINDSTGKTLLKKGKYIGKTTNNVAEYRAVIEALKWIKLSIKYSRPRLRLAEGGQVSSITFFLDSKLIVNQLNGLFKIKNSRLRNLIIKVRQLEKEVGGNVSYRFISREKNKEADALVNQNLNQKSL